MDTEEVPSKQRKVEFAIDGENDADSPGDENEDEAPEKTGLPHSVSIKQFLAGREEEVKLLRTFLKGKSDKKMTVAQRSLPISMRRRAMSHNAKRFPKRLRTAALIKQIGESKTTKRPSRKYRRKPRNLLAEYIRRQRDHVWLETHVWHAKRFRMSELWGYKIATRSNAKIYRSCHRAVKSELSCLMTDVSYLNCMELRGSEETLEAGLKELTDDSLPEARKEENLLFHRPKSAEGSPTIGPVRVLRLLRSTSSSSGVFWLWVHPSTTEEVLAALQETFGLNKTAPVEDSSMVFCPEDLEEYVEEESSQTEEPVTVGDVQNGVLKVVANGDCKKKKKKKKKTKKKAKENIDLAKLKNKNVPFERTPKYSSPNSDVELILLKDTLNRFRLIGRGCRAILTEVLRPVKAEQLVKSKWFAHFTEDFSVSSIESDDLNSLTASGTTLSLVVRDPRALLPPKRLQVVKIEEPEAVDDVVPEDREEPPESSHWPIICHRVRDTLISTKVPDSKINALRKALRENGKEVDELDLGEDEACVPLLVVPVEDYRVCTIRDLDAGLVCDVIIPAGWGMSFWIPFVFRNAKVGCLKELSNFCFEASTLVFPRDYPDTNAGRRYRELAMEEAKNEYFKRPPAHRPNYIKMGVFWPFGPKYDELLQRCMPEFYDKRREDFDVLRDLPRVNFLWSLVSYKPRFQVKVSEEEESFQVTHDGGHETSVSLKSLIWVKLITLGKGTLDDLSMVYVPHPSDLSQEKEAFDLWEPNHEDLLSETRAKLRAEHKAELDRAHRHRQRQRRKRRENDDKSKNLPVVKVPKEEDHADFAAKIHSMSTPDPGIETAHVNNIRDVFGIVERGDYSLTRGRGKALALVSCYKLVKLLDDQCEWKNVIVLVRGITKSQYVKAELTVL